MTEAEVDQLQVPGDASLEGDDLRVAERADEFSQVASCQTLTALPMVGPASRSTETQAGYQRQRHLIGRARAEQTRSNRAARGFAALP